MSQISAMYRREKETDEVKKKGRGRRKHNLVSLNGVNGQYVSYLGGGVSKCSQTILRRRKRKEEKGKRKMVRFEVLRAMKRTGGYWGQKIKEPVWEKTAARLASSSSEFILKQRFFCTFV
jgi:hypothetical protein